MPTQTDEQALQQKDAATWPGSTPKLIRTAISRVFSITIMVRAMRILSAATQTIRADDDEGDDLLQLEGAEEFAVLLHPVGGQKAVAGGLLDLTSDLVGAVEVVDLEGDDGDQVGLAKEPLRIGEAVNPMLESYW